MAGGLLSLPNILLASDLNFIISSFEFQGSKARTDPLASSFTQIITSNNLVDLSMNYPGPTWRNGSADDDGNSKRLDRFLLSASLIPHLKRHRV